MTRHLDFKGRTAVITGAGSGIGAALAAALAARGANLALADINEARLQEVADALKSNEIKVTTHKVDVADKDQIAAFAALPDDRKDALRSLTAIHSARLAYAPDGTYGEKDEGRSMAIRPDESANATQLHPLIQPHPETGEEAIFSTLGYIIGIEGMEQPEAIALLSKLAQWQVRDEFVYRHRWEPDMLVIWDNRSVLHKATGGYEGHRRELHRTTIAAAA